MVKKSHDQYIKFQASQQNNVQGSQLLRAPESIGIQLGAMSATVGNINALASWFSAQLYVSTFRPVPLRECVVVGEDVLDTQGKVLHRLSLGSSAKSKPSPLELTNRVIIQLCMDGIKNGQQILIFCPTKQMCQQTCELILKQLVPLSRKIFTHPSISWTEEQLLFRRQQAYQELGNSEDDLLAKVTAKDPAASASTIASQLQIYIQSGLGFHHSGLNSKQRSLIENAFRSGEISILAATSTLAAGVNLPAGRVIIRSLLMGRDELNVTNYKQMTGRAGRAGQCVNDCGESFLLAAPSDLTKALKLVNQPLPDVNSQMNPRLDGGRGLMKAILEMHSLNICRTLADTLEYVKGTLLYQESTSSTPSYSSSNSFDHGMLDTVLNAFNFLLLANALDIPSLTPPPPPVSTKPPAKVSSSTVQSLIPTIVKEVPSTPCLTPGNLSEFQDRPLIITRFGRAIVQSSMNPDEAIIVYKDLLQAQNGINLESNLHLIYLLTPVENSFTPDFSEMLKWYERGKQATKARDPKDEFVGQSMGLEEAYGYLNNWSHKPPTHDDITTCVEKVRNMSLRTWEDHKDTKNKLYYECLVRCKRVWAARVVDKILQKGDTPLHTIASSLHVSPFDLENLRRSVNMVCTCIA